MFLGEKNLKSALDVNNEKNKIRATNKRKHGQKSENHTNWFSIHLFINQLVKLFGIIYFLFI